MKREKKKRVMRAPVLFLLQVLCTAFISALASLSMLTGGILHIVCVYILLPLLCAFIAEQCVYRGLNNYLALIPVPFTLPVVHLLIWGYAPGAAYVLIPAFVTVFGSAWGETLKRQNKHTRGRL